jgi:hypothetical protein
METEVKPHLWIVRLNIINMSLISQLIYTFNTISIKVPQLFFWKLVSQFKIYM